MQAYEGYFENGIFYSVGAAVQIPDHRRVFITILNEPAAGDVETARRVAALEKFFSEIEKSDEEVPEFERVKFREVEI